MHYVGSLFHVSNLCCVNWNTFLFHSVFLFTLCLFIPSLTPVKALHPSTVQPEGRPFSLLLLSFSSKQTFFLSFFGIYLSTWMRPQPSLCLQHCDCVVYLLQPYQFLSALIYFPVYWSIHKMPQSLEGPRQSRPTPLRKLWCRPFVLFAFVTTEQFACVLRDGQAGLNDFSLFPLFWGILVVTVIKIRPRNTAIF